MRLLAAFLIWLLPTSALAAGGCLPVASLKPRIVPASFSLALKQGEVELTYIGHSSFLIRSPEGATAITDYTGRTVDGVIPDIVSMNNAHMTHYTEAPDPRIKHVLRGWDQGEGPARWNVTHLDMRVRNVPTNVRDYYTGGTRRHGNSVFVFEAGDLCIAHLGHLHHVLTDLQAADIGQIDVLLVPIDGSVTLGHEMMVQVVEELRPKLIIPMHYGSVEQFIQIMGPNYPAKRHDSDRVVLSRANMPRKAEILVLRGELF
jgi:L-ascorbate metabolism protein UlaG (beta-lactamase superfamily)